MTASATRAQGDLFATPSALPAPPKPALALVSPFGLRDYQVAAVEAVREELREHRGTLVLCATGTGKTQISCELIRTNPGRCLFIAHRDELIQQAAKRIEQFTGQWPDIEQAELRANATGGAHVVASVQTLSRPKRLERFDPGEFSLIVIDECFPAGTDVGGVPIEKIRVGDAVMTHTGIRRRVEKLFRKKPTALVRLRAGSTSVVCTPSHPFLTAGGWARAGYLHVDDMVLCITDEQKDTLRTVRGEDHKETAREPATLLRRVHQDPQGGAQKDRNAPVRRVRKAGGAIWKGRAELGAQGAGVLLRDAQEHFLLSSFLLGHAEHEQETCISEDAPQQPDAPPRCARQTESLLAYSWMAGVCAARGERSGNGSANNAGEPSWVGDGGCNTDGGADGSRISEVLQGRHWGTDVANRGRGGREVSQSLESQGRGRQERPGFAFARVDSVEILQPTSDGTFAGLCPDGRVYNLEVEGDHSYTANGFVVHNCHHGTSKTYRRVIDYFAGKLVGLTATPDRSDKEALGQILDSVAYRYDILDAIRDGWLCKITMRRIRVDSMDFSGIHALAGDFNEGELAKLMEMEQNLHAVAKPAVDCVGDRKTIVFTTSVAHAERLAEIIDRYAGAKRAMVVHGETPKDDRRALLRQFHDGTWQYLVNVGICTEGFDEPGVACIVMGRPTKSRSLYTQMLGRGTRGGERCPVVGKPDLLVLDFVGNSGKHELVSTADVLGGRASEQEIERAKQIAEKSERPKSVEEALEEARVSIENERTEAARKRREKLVGEVRYSVEDFNPYVVFGIRRDYLTERYGMAPATEKQLSTIRKWMGKQAKSIPENLSTHEASRLIGHLSRRFDARLASYGQIACLAKNGMDARPWAFEQASQVIQWMADNHWRRPPAEVVASIVRPREPGEDG